MNKVVIIGRLTRDPEVKFLPGTGTATCTITLAVDRRVKKEGQQEADFIQVTVWGKAAENVANYMSKGRLLGVAGRIQTRTYDAKDGTRKYITEVVAEEVQFLDKGNNTPVRNPLDSYDGQYFEDEMQPIDDGDIPF